MPGTSGISRRSLFAGSAAGTAAALLPTAAATAAPSPRPGPRPRTGPSPRRAGRVTAPRTTSRSPTSGRTTRSGPSGSTASTTTTTSTTPTTSPAHVGTAWRLATSNDLVSFADRGVAVPKDTTPNGDLWSGSAVVDTGNTAGFGAGAVVVIVTMSPDDGTDHQAQFLYYSTDGGRTFTNYGTDPVLPNPGVADFRDPKVIRDEDRGPLGDGPRRERQDRLLPLRRPQVLDVRERFRPRRHRRPGVPRPVPDHAPATAP